MRRKRIILILKVFKINSFNFLAYRILLYLFMFLYNFLYDKNQLLIFIYGHPLTNQNFFNNAF